MMGIKAHQEKLFYNFSLSKRIPEDHFLKKVDRIVDLRFVRELVKPYYSTMGQPSIDPEVLFKMMLIGYFYNITSERKLAEEISVNLAYMWYLGYDIDEVSPNHSVISKARVRFGKEVFEQFFKKILEQCIKAGLVKCEKVFMDSTLIEANASVKSIVHRSEALEVKMGPKEYTEKVYAENPVFGNEITRDANEHNQGKGDAEDKKDINSNDMDKLPVYESQTTSQTKNYKKKHMSNSDYVSTTDPDSSIVSRLFMGLRLCYKEHFTIDREKRVITGVEVTNGITDDSRMFKKLLDCQPFKPKEVCGDSKYGTAENFQYSFEQGVLPSMPRWTKPPIRKAPNQWGQEKFKYDEDQDAYICPSGHRLKKVAFYKHSKQWGYRSRVKECNQCEFKNKCLGPKSTCKNINRHIYQQTIDRALEYLKTFPAKDTIRERKAYAEWAIAEGKTFHGLRRARFRGKWKVNIQALLIASVQNIKRLVKHYEVSCRNIPENVAIINKNIYNNFCKIREKTKKFLFDHFGNSLFVYTSTRTN